jgi:hypothetical protein
MENKIPLNPEHREAEATQGRELVGQLLDSIERMGAKALTAIEQREGHFWVIQIQRFAGEAPPLPKDLPEGYHDFSSGQDGGPADG